MPTGYTAGIIDGDIKTFEEFAKICMRAFGALVHMRDESLDTPYRPKEPSEYYLKRIKESQKAILDLQLISDEELIKQERITVLEEIEHHRNEMRKDLKLKVKLNSFLEKAKAWQPPTPDHEGYKSFMIDQLQRTIEFDANVDYHKNEIDELKATEFNADEIRSRRLDSANRDLEYNTENYQKDLKRSEDSNKWVEQVYKTFEP